MLDCSLLKGCISQPGILGEQGLVTTLFAKKHKVQMFVYCKFVKNVNCGFDIYCYQEAAMTLSRKLLEALSEEGIAASLTAGNLGRGPMQQVKELVDKFR